MHNGQPVVIARSSFTRSGEVVVRAKDQNVVFPDAAVTHNLDRDFEASHLTLRFTALADDAICDPQPTGLDRFVKIRMIDVTHSTWVGNNLPLVRVSDGLYRWMPFKPFLFKRGDAVSVCVDARDSFDIAYEGKRRRIDAIRIELSFEGELLTYAVPQVRDVGVEAPLG